MRAQLSCLLLGGLTGLIKASEDDWITPQSDDSAWELRLKCKEHEMRVELTNPDLLQSAHVDLNRAQLTDAGISSRMAMTDICPHLAWLWSHQRGNVEGTGDDQSLGLLFRESHESGVPDTTIVMRIPMKPMSMDQIRLMYFKQRAETKEMKAAEPIQAPSAPIEDQPISIADSQELPDLRNVVQRTFDLQKMDHNALTLIKSSNALQKSSMGGEWSTAGVTEPFFSGTNSIKFRLVKSKLNRIKFGVISENHFRNRLYLGHDRASMAYYSYGGSLNHSGRGSPFSRSSKTDDVIEITVHIDEEDLSQSTIAFFQNDQELGVKSLTSFMKLEGPLMFAVSLYDQKDEVQIVD